MTASEEPRGTNLVLSDTGQCVLIEPAPNRIRMTQMPPYARVPPAYRLRGSYQLKETNEFFSDNDIGSGACVRFEVVTPGRDTFILWGTIHWERWNMFTWEEA